MANSIYDSCNQFLVDKTLIIALSGFSPEAKEVFCDALADFCYDYGETKPDFSEIPNDRERKTVERHYEQFVTVAIGGCNSKLKKQKDGGFYGKKGKLQGEYIDHGFGDKNAFEEFFKGCGGNLEEAKHRLKEMMNSKISDKEPFDDDGEL